MYRAVTAKYLPRWQRIVPHLLFAIRPQGHDIAGVWSSRAGAQVAARRDHKCSERSKTRSRSNCHVYRSVALPSNASRDEYKHAADESASLAARIKLREFIKPIVSDGLVIGAKSPIDGPTLRRALGLLLNVPFELVTFEAEVLGAVLKRFPATA